MKMTNFHDDRKGTIKERSGENKMAIAIPPVSVTQPADMKSYEQKRDQLMQQQQKQRTLKDNQNKTFKERLEDQMRLFFD